MKVKYRVPCDGSIVVDDFRKWLGLTYLDRIVQIQSHFASISFTVVFHPDRETIP